MILVKDSISLFLVVATLALLAPPSNGQGNTPGAFYNKPAELKLERFVRKSFGRYLRQQASDYYRRRPFDQLVPESFFPIGWSRDGKFAYYLEPVDEACGCYFANLFILDLKNDSVLWSFDYDSEAIDEARQQGKPYSFDTLWKANARLFAEKLKEYKIEPQARFTLLSFPVEHNGQTIRANLKTFKKPGLTEEESWYGSIGRTTLELHSNRRGKKTILNETHPEVRPLSVGLLGYLKSPFEPRVAVVLMNIIRGWEGPPHTGDVQIVGASLQDGFRKH